MSLIERILLGAFIFGIIGLFTILGVLTPGVGWFLYLFLIPFLGHVSRCGGGYNRCILSF